jgi:cob(I)alamin adenosyltransferase
MKFNRSSKAILRYEIERINRELTSLHNVMLNAQLPAMTKLDEARQNIHCAEALLTDAGRFLDLLGQEHEDVFDRLDI